MKDEKNSVKPKHIKNKILPVDDDIEFDDRRRLRNALIALARLDPGWIIWVERHVPEDISGTSPRIVRMIVERQARKLAVRGYSSLGPVFSRGVIDSDLYFTDDGALKAYR